MTNMSKESKWAVSESESLQEYYRNTLNRVWHEKLIEYSAVVFFFRLNQQSLFIR